MTDDPVTVVVAAFSGRKRARSQVYQWLLAHYNELSAARKTGRRVDWVGVTAELKVLGLKAHDKKVLKPESVRRAWHRVDTDVKAGVIAPGNSKRPTAAPPAPAPAAPVRRIDPPPSDDDDGGYDFDKTVKRET